MANFIHVFRNPLNNEKNLVTLVYIEIGISRVYANC